MQRIVTSVIGTCAMVVLAAGVGVAASSHASPKTFSGCLNSHTHTLSNVTESPTKARACKKGTKRVTWGAQGPVGKTGKAGKAAPASAGGESFVPLIGYASTTEADPCSTLTTNAWEALPAPDCPSSQTTTFKSALINSSAFGPKSTIRLDASVELDPTNGEFTASKVCVRLWDITAQKPVGSPACASTEERGTPIYPPMVSTVPVALPTGDHYYKLELQLPNNNADGRGDQEGGYVAQATAVIENK